MPLVQLIRSAHMLTNINNDRPYSYTSERLNMEQTGMLSRNRGMCERHPQIQQTSKNHHPSFPHLSPRACQRNERYVQRVGASSRVRRQQAKKIKGSAKTRVFMCSNKRGTSSKYRRPPATIYLRMDQDCQGTACYGTRLVGLSACAHDNRSPTIEAPKQRVVMCANKWESNNDTTVEDQDNGRRRRISVQGF